jgi:serine/threonine protein kinase
VLLDVEARNVVFCEVMGARNIPMPMNWKKRERGMAKAAKVFETAFETYTVVRQVGSGGSSVVFLVKTSEGQDLALKVLDRSKTPRQKVKRFQNEIQFCQRQASERIVRVLDYGQAPDGSIFLCNAILCEHTPRSDQETATDG